jgi:hypothetical protein
VVPACLGSYRKGCRCPTCKARDKQQRQDAQARERRMPTLMTRLRRDVGIVRTRRFTGE